MPELVDNLKHQLRSYKRQLEKYTRAIASQADALSVRTPSIFVNTLPKSGSVFILGSLRKSTQLKFQKIAYGYYPSDLIDYKKIKSFSRGGKISLQHLDAHPTNLTYLEKYARRWVLHLRDPRGSLLSWVHHLDRLHREDMQDQLGLYPFLPEGYFTWDMPRKIDWNIEHYLTDTIAWIRGWGEYYSSRKDTMLVTTHNELSRNSEALVSRILGFYDIPQPKIMLVKKTIDNHFRKGEAAEWKTVFTPAQLADAARICGQLGPAFPGISYLVE